MMTFFIVLQSILLIFMLFHDWIPVPPFNHIEDLKKENSFLGLFFSSAINGTIVLIPLIITIVYYSRPLPTLAIINILIFYLVMTLGTIFSWWTPYFFGSSKKHKEHFEQFKNTHHFLPVRGDNVIPNTLHVILHLQVWMCLTIALYFLLKR